MATSILNVNTRKTVEELAIKAVEYDRNEDYDNALIFYDKVVSLIFETSKTLKKKGKQKVKENVTNVYRAYGINQSVIAFT